MTTKETATGDTASSASQAPHVASDKASSKKAPSQKKKTPTWRKSAGGRSKTGVVKKGGGTKASAASPAKAMAPRAGSKGASILEMMRRAKGATLAEIMKATGWQAHSVRGYVSTATKKGGIKIDSTRNDAGVRFYRIAP